MPRVHVGSFFITQKFGFFISTQTTMILVKCSQNANVFRNVFRVEQQYLIDGQWTMDMNCKYRNILSFLLTKRKENPEQQ